MKNEINIYCDESSYLESDNMPHMVMGAVWCEKQLTKSAFKRIREIKVKNGLSPHFEIKWSKVSKAKEKFYIELVDYFFDSAFLNFRGIVS